MTGSVAGYLTLTLCLLHPHSSKTSSEPLALCCLQEWGGPGQVRVPQQHSVHRQLVTGGDLQPSQHGPSSAGKLLDATHVYQYVFILAGAEVLTASLVLVLGNFLCIRKRPEVVAAVAEEEQCHKPPADVRVDSREVEHFLKAEPEKNGEVIHTPETSV